MPLNMKRAEPKKESIPVEESGKRVENETASTERLQLVTDLVSRKFGLDDYSVVKFNDKGKVIEVALSNEDFIVAITIKNSDTFGLSVD